MMTIMLAMMMIIMMMMIIIHDWTICLPMHPGDKIRVYNWTMDMARINVLGRPCGWRLSIIHRSSSLAPFNNELVTKSIFPQKYLSWLTSSLDKHWLLNILWLLCRHTHIFRRSRFHSRVVISFIHENYFHWIVQFHTSFKKSCLCESSKPFQMEVVSCRAERRIDDESHLISPDQHLVLEMIRLSRFHLRMVVCHCQSSKTIHSLQHAETGGLAMSHTRLC